MEENKKENVFKRILKKEIIISLVIGLLLGILIMVFGNGGIEAFVSGKFITEGNIYNKIKEQHSSLDIVLENIDSAILNKKYKLTEEEKSEIEKQAKEEIEYYMDLYGYTQDEIIEMYGFSSYESFIDSYMLDYKRTVNLYEYLENKLEENSVENYYNENAFGKVNTKHILVRTSDDMDETQALQLANEMISKLNNGENFDTLAQEYTTNYSDKVITEDLGEIGAFDSIEEAYINAMKELEVGKYTQTPVKTSYGYHIIYCVDKKEKEDTISISDKMMIVYHLAEEAGIEVGNTMYYKALIEMREKAGLRIFDKELKTHYEEFCETYEEE